MRRLLYYPYISIPNATWLVHGLLYWDGIATIVPTEYLQRPQQFSPFARKLLRAGVIQSVLPEEYAYRNYHEFYAFLEWTEQNASLFRRKENKEGGSISTIRQYNLHAGKLGYIGVELEKLGLAQRIDESWYEVDRQLSMAFMTFLATLIGREENYIPTTDSYQGFSCLCRAKKNTPYNNSKMIRDAFRGSILDKLLPVPTEIEDFSDILRFKERHNDELIRFRNHIEEFMIVLEGLPNEELRKERCACFIKDMQDEVEDLKGRMGWFRSPKIDMGTLIAALPCTLELLNGNLPVAAASLASLVGEMTYNGARTENRRKPVAYAALYQSRFGRHKSIRG